MQGIRHNEDLRKLRQQSPGAQRELAGNVLRAVVCLEASHGLGGVDLEDSFVDEMDVTA